MAKAVAPVHQITAAREQHHSTIQSIKYWDRKAHVRLVVIPLGVAGTIYTGVTEDLQQQLGVWGPALKTLLRNLHLHAIRTLTRIIKCRRIAMGARTGRSTYNSSSGSNSKPWAQGSRKRPIPQKTNYKYRKKRKKR